MRTRLSLIDFLESFLGVTFNFGDDMAAETAYCVKCREKTIVKEPQEVKMKNGRPALRGKCSVCSTGVYKIRASVS